MDSNSAEWSVEEAAVHLPEVVRLALQSPQRINVEDDRAVVMISAAEYDRLACRTRDQVSLVSFLGAAPLADLDLDRSTDLSRSDDP